MPAVEGCTCHSVKENHLGRSSREKQAVGVARFSFEELCTRPLGAADYLSIARHYHTVLIDHVPKMAQDRQTSLWDAWHYPAVLQHMVVLHAAALCTPDI